MKRQYDALNRRLASGLSRLKNIYYYLFAPHKAPLNKYNSDCPHPQQMIDLFDKEWISSFPSPYNHLKAGKFPLFEDPRVIWGIHHLGGIENKKVLELGPLEGGHSFILQQHGACSVTSIEANPRAYLRCLMTKQMMKLNKVDFLFGDFTEYLKTNSESFDVCIASGVLYHMKNPMELISMISKKCSRLFLWTQYYDPVICKKWKLRSKFLKSQQFEVEGFRHEVYPFKYGSSRFWQTFIGGPATLSSWLSREDILRGLDHFGFKDVQIHFEERDSEHGPSFALAAKKLK